MPIASCLIDTNILLRIQRRSDPQHPIVHSALSKLVSDGTLLCFAQQNIAELWNVMTRPMSRNGFGLSSADAEREVRVIESGMERLREGDATYQMWRRIIVEDGVLGVQVHDARLVAIMRVHNVQYILTLNVADFDRYRGIVVVHPGNVSGM